MKVFVTGGTGFVGTHLVKRLMSEGHDVTVLIHRTPATALEGLEIRTCSGSIDDADMLEEQLKDIEVVFHLAGVVSIDPLDEPILQRVNVQGTHNVVAACLKTDVRRLVHMSSIHALASEPPGAVVDESGPLSLGAHHHPYDRSKAMGQQVVLHGVEQGLDAVILNPVGIMGPEDRLPTPVGEMLLQLYHHSIPGLVAAGFHWVDVRDVVQGVMLALERGTRGQGYLLSSQYATIAEIAGLVREITGASTPTMVTPMWLARMFAPCVTGYSKLRGKKPLYTSSSLKMLRHHQRLDTSRATDGLTFQPRSLADTLADTFAWFKSAGLLEVASG
jgi:dihydroflavonol-4-reductase